ncbi:Bro-N domain-containing protein [Pseudomonas shahriarae]|uniref:BRO-N domain-containing protein n=1 Tax=Pseudomonas shahriarae TaxID=2745512 RepID=UPI0020766F35|nr:Bro-N domain-containing protein [Pseudomonas shahriarae]MCM8559764.1 Bro-N domain-containing protein [Pseudomonas shahriarae]
MNKSNRHEKASSAPTLEAHEAERQSSRKNVMSDISTTVSNVIPFNFGKQQVRTLLINDQPWFVATDVCESLAIVNTARALSRLDEDERGIHSMNTLGGAQNLSVVNESGLYSLILTSRKAEAKIFKKWVTAEVLPTIRKHGRYEDTTGKMNTLVGQTIGTDGFHMLGAVVKGKVSSLSAPIQRRATAKIWSQTHAAFGVRSAADIPADQLDAARNFIAAYAVLEGEFIPKGQGKSFDIPDKLGQCERYLVSADHHGNRQVTPVPMGAFVLTRQQFMQSMLVDRDMPVSTAEMFEFVALATENLRCRFLFQAARRDAA